MLFKKNKNKKIIKSNQASPIVPAASANVTLHFQYCMSALLETERSKVIFNIQEEGLVQIN